MIWELPHTDPGTLPARSCRTPRIVKDGALGQTHFGDVEFLAAEHGLLERVRGIALTMLTAACQDTGSVWEKSRNCDGFQQATGWVKWRAPGDVAQVEHGVLLRVGADQRTVVSTCENTSNCTEISPCAARNPRIRASTGRVVS